MERRYQVFALPEEIYFCRRRWGRHASFNMVCLASPESIYCPSSDEQGHLQINKLGEKRISIPPNDLFKDFDDTVKVNFSALSDAGGYELLRSERNSRIQLSPLQCSEAGYTSNFLKPVIGQAKCYIRPLQTDLLSSSSCGEGSSSSPVSVELKG